MKVIKVIKDEKKKNDKGKEYRVTYYAIEADGGNIVPIKPLYDDGYPKLDLISEKRFSKSSKKGK